MAKGKNIAYVRVSTTDQNEARQNEALDKYNIDKWYIEKITGKDTNRPKLIEMLDFIREDDTVYVEEYSREGTCPSRYLLIVTSPKPRTKARGPFPISYIFNNLLISSIVMSFSFSLYCESISLIFKSSKPGRDISSPHSLHTATVIKKVYSLSLITFLISCFFNV